MFKKEINFISDLNLNKIHELGDRFTIEKISKSKIHPAIFHYVNAAIDLEIYFDRKKIEVDSVFHYNGDRINNYFGLITEEIKRTHNFDFNYIKLILQNAITFNINYLTRPNKTLANFVFGEFETKSIDEIVIRISHAYYYRYLQKILLTYLDKKKILSMKREEFISLMGRIDLVSKETHLDNTIFTAISSMANFFDQSSKSSDKLPIEAIYLYLEEKGLTEYISKLEEKLGDDSTAFYLANDVVNIIKSVTPETEMILLDTERIEDEFISDNSEQDEINLEADFATEVSEIETISDETNEINSNEIFEVSVDDVEIPNHEILSNDEIIAQNTQETSDVDETMESNESTADFDLEAETDSINENIEKVEEDLKKKPQTESILNELIDLDTLYDSLFPSLIPFESNIAKLKQDNFKEKLLDEINYQIDISTLKDEINIKKISTSGEDYSPYLPNYSLEEDELADEKFEDITFPEEKKSQDDLEIEINSEESEYLKLNNTIENVINDRESDLEFETINELDINSNDYKDEQNDFENLIDDQKLTLVDGDDEELTEVFTDLTYLDQKEEIISPNTKNSSNEADTDNNSKKNKKEGFQNNSSTNDSDNSPNFSDLLASKDVTKIIEIMFDYDMEDYYSLISKISESANETEAMNYTDQYCLSNHIEISSNEVETFKSFISHYFTQAFS